MSIHFVLDSRAAEEPAAVHTVATLGTLLETPFEIRRSVASEGDRAGIVYVGDPQSAPAECAAILPFNGWPDWDLASLMPARLPEGVLPCPRGDSGAPSTDQALPGVCLRSLAFLLHREEEKLDLRRDQWNCFSGFSTQLREWNLIERPLINEWADQLSLRIRAWAERTNLSLPRVPRWKDGRRFAVALTHDVDWVRRYSLPQSLRLLGQARSPKSYAFRQGMRSVAEAIVHPYDRHDPYCMFERWIDEESRRGFHSTFYFCPSRPRPRHEYDPTYRMTDSAQFLGRRVSVAELIRAIAASGAEVGLHGSYESYQSASELLRQKEEIEHATGLKLNGVRQHYLRFDVRNTWLAQERAGFEYDATLGYNEAIGFRAGISAPFRPYDLEARATRDLLELPTTVMDGTLFRTLELDTGRAAARIRSHLDVVERAGGLAVLLWHPNVTDREAFPGWWDAYVAALDDLAGRDAWVTTAGEIASWWREREQRMTNSRLASQPQARGFV